MKKIASAVIAALTLGALLCAPVLAFDPLRATTVFTNLAADPKLKNPSVILIDASTGEQLFSSNSYAMRKPASTPKYASSRAGHQASVPCAYKAALAPANKPWAAASS